jgi:ribosomal protein S18 acetylase RimI-like enzyme
MANPARRRLRGPEGYGARVDSLTVRPAGSGDASELSDLARRTWSDAFGDGVSAKDEASELEERRSESYFAHALGTHTILVAELNGRLLAYVEFGEVSIPEVEALPGDQELHRLYVESTLQGRGLGRALMEAALEHPRLSVASRVFLQVWDENEKALRLYESFGFQTVGTTTFTVGSEVMEDLIMLLDKTDST